MANEVTRSDGGSRKSSRRESAGERRRDRSSSREGKKERKSIRRSGSQDDDQRRRDSRKVNKSKRRDSERGVEPANGAGDGQRAPAFDPHVQSQFPGQFPSTFSGPYRPPGEAAHYYGDQGESVAYQPGVRPQPPSIIHTADQAHLHEASTEAAPPPEPSSLGQMGAAASFFASTSDVENSTPQPPGRVSRPSMNPSMHSNTGASPRTSPGPGGRPSSFSGSVSMPGAAATSPVGGGLASEYYSGQSVPTLGANGFYTSPTSNMHDQPYNTGSAMQTSGPPRPSGQHSNNTALYGAAAAGLAAGAGAHYLHQQHSQHASHAGHGQYQPSAPQGSSSMGMMHRHKRRGPLDKLVDFFKDPEGVAEFEVYTEAIGVCKYCFDPRSSPKDAPRKHNRNRRYSGGRYGSNTRVDKAYRQSSSDEEKRRKSSSKKPLIAGGLAGYGLAKLGENILNNKDFDDTYSVQTGHPNDSQLSLGRSQRRSSGRKGESFSRDSPSVHQSTSHRSTETRIRKDKATGELYEERIRRKTRTSSPNSSSASHHGLATGAALGASIAASRSSEKGRRKRSRSPKKRYYSKRVSPNHSYVDLSSTAAGSAAIGSFFSSPSANRRKGKKPKGLFGFNNPSSSSSDADLAFGEGSVRRKESIRDSRRRKGDDNADSAILGLAATGAALAAASSRNGSNRDRKSEIIPAKESHGHGQGRSGGQYSSSKRHSAPDDENSAWEDASEGESSDNSALAYGTRLSARQSRESLPSNDGTAKWAWRWNRGKKSKAEKTPQGRVSTLLDTPSFAGQELGISSTNYGRSGATESTSTLPPMQQLYPMPTSDPGIFDVARQGSSAISPMTTIPPSISSSTAPLQHPQPITPVSPEVYTSTAPSGTPGDSESMASTRFAGEQSGSMQDYVPTLDQPNHMDEGKGRRRRASSPARFKLQDEVSYAKFRRRTSTREQAPSVKFDLTEEQAEREQRAGARDRRQSGRVESEDQQLRKSSVRDGYGQYESGAGRPDKEFAETREDSAERRRLREQEIERELQRLHEEDRQQSGDRKTKRGDYAAEVVGAAATAAGVAAGAAAIRSVIPRDETEHRERSSRGQPSITDDSGTRDTERHVEDEVNDTERRRRRIAEKVAIRVKTSPSPVRHDNYATFFTPPEIQEKLKEHNDAAERRQSPEPTSPVSPHVIEIVPKGGSLPTSPSLPTATDFKFDPFNYAPFGFKRSHDPSAHPWPVPRLDLIEPTPPHSARTSVRGHASPVPPASPEPSDPSEPRSQRSRSEARVSWGKHQTHEFDVVTPVDDVAEFVGERSTSIGQALEDPPGAFPIVVEVRPRGPVPTDEEEAAPRSSEGFGHDLEFAAALAAGVQEAGFDPSIVLDDPTYHRRESPPGSEAKGFYQSPFAETRSDLDVSVSQPLPPQGGFVEVELPPTPKAGEGPPYAGDDTERGLTELPTSKLSKKERRRMEKAAKRNAKADDEQVEVIADIETSGSQRQSTVEAPPLGTENDADESSTSKLSRKERRRLEKAASRDPTADDQQRELMTDDVNTASQPQPPIENLKDDGKVKLPGAFSASDYPDKNVRLEANGTTKPDLSKEYSPIPSARDAIVEVEKELYSGPPMTGPPLLFSDKDDESVSRKSGRKPADLYDDRSVDSTPPKVRDDVDSRKKSKRRLKRGDDDTGSVASMPADIKSGKDSRRTSKDKKSGGIFGFFSSGKSGDSPQESSPAEQNGDSSREHREESIVSTKQGKRKSKDRDSDDKAPARKRSRSGSRSANGRTERRHSPDDEFVSSEEAPVKDPSETRSRADNNGEESFLGERPEMPTVHDGASGFVTGRTLADDIATVPTTSGIAPEHEVHTSDVSQSESTMTASAAPALEGGDLAPGEAALERSQIQPRRLSQVRTGSLAFSPLSITSPTAVPLHFRRMPISPGFARSASVGGPGAASLPSSPITPRARQGRPSSIEIRSREFRPLWLVERHAAAKPEQSEVEESYPSLPSSRTSSAHPSMEDLRKSYDYEDVFSPQQVSSPSFTHRRSSSYPSVHEDRPISPDFLDSRTATPTATEFAKEVKKEKPKYEFHSPSELLQDPAFLREQATTTDASMSPMTLPRALTSEPSDPESLPALPDSRPSSPWTNDESESHRSATAQPLPGAGVSHMQAESPEPLQSTAIAKEGPRIALGAPIITHEPSSSLPEMPTFEPPDREILPALPDSRPSSPLRYDEAKSYFPATVGPLQNDDVVPKQALSSSPLTSPAIPKEVPINIQKVPTTSDEAPTSVRQMPAFDVLPDRLSPSAPISGEGESSSIPTIEPIGHPHAPMEQLPPSEGEALPPLPESMPSTPVILGQDATRFLSISHIPDSTEPVAVNLDTSTEGTPSAHSHIKATAAERENKGATTIISEHTDSQVEVVPIASEDKEATTVMTEDHPNQFEVAPTEGEDKEPEDRHRQIEVARTKIPAKEQQGPLSQVEIASAESGDKVFRTTVREEPSDRVRSPPVPGANEDIIMPNIRENVFADRSSENNGKKSKKGKKQKGARTLPVVEMPEATAEFEASTLATSSRSLSIPGRFDDAVLDKVAPEESKLQSATLDAPSTQSEATPQLSAGQNIDAEEDEWAMPIKKGKKGKNAQKGATVTASAAEMAEQDKTPDTVNAPIAGSNIADETEGLQEQIAISKDVDVKEDDTDKDVWVFTTKKAKKGKKTKKNISTSTGDKALQDSTPEAVSDPVSESVTVDGTVSGPERTETPKQLDTKEDDKGEDEWALTTKKGKKSKKQKKNQVTSTEVVEGDQTPQSLVESVPEPLSAVSPAEAHTQMQAVEVLEKDQRAQFLVQQVPKSLPAVRQAEASEVNTEMLATEDVRNDDEGALSTGKGETDENRIGREVTSAEVLEEARIAQSLVSPVQESLPAMTPVGVSRDVSEPTRRLPETHDVNDDEEWAFSTKKGKKDKRTKKSKTFDADRLEEVKLPQPPVNPVEEVLEEVKTPRSLMESVAEQPLAEASIESNDRAPEISRELQTADEARGDEEWAVSTKKSKKEKKKQKKAKSPLAEAPTTPAAPQTPSSELEAAPEPTKAEPASESVETSSIADVEPILAHQDGVQPEISEEALASRPELDVSRKELAAEEDDPSWLLPSRKSKKDKKKEKKAKKGKPALEEVGPSQEAEVEVAETTSERNLRPYQDAGVLETPMDELSVAEPSRKSETMDKVAELVKTEVGPGSIEPVGVPEGGLKQSDRVTELPKEFEESQRPPAHITELRTGEDDRDVIQPQTSVETTDKPAAVATKAVDEAPIVEEEKARGPPTVVSGPDSEGISNSISVENALQLIDQHTSSASEQQMPPASGAAIDTSKEVEIPESTLSAGASAGAERTSGPASREMIEERIAPAGDSTMAEAVAEVKDVPKEVEFIEKPTAFIDEHGNVEENAKAVEAAREAEEARQTHPEPQLPKKSQPGDAQDQDSFPKIDFSDSPIVAAPSEAILAGIINEDADKQRESTIQPPEDLPAESPAATVEDDVWGFATSKKTKKGKKKKGSLQSSPFEVSETHTPVETFAPATDKANESLPALVTADIPTESASAKAEESDWGFTTSKKGKKGKKKKAEQALTSEASESPAQKENIPPEREAQEAVEPMQAADTTTEDAAIASASATMEEDTWGFTTSKKGKKGKKKKNGQALSTPDVSETPSQVETPSVEHEDTDAVVPIVAEEVRGAIELEPLQVQEEAAIAPILSGDASDPFETAVVQNRDKDIITATMADDTHRPSELPPAGGSDKDITMLNVLHDTPREIKAPSTHEEDPTAIASVVPEDSAINPSPANDEDDAWGFTTKKKSKKGKKQKDARRGSAFETSMAPAGVGSPSPAKTSRSFSMPGGFDEEMLEEVVPTDDAFTATLQEASSTPSEAVQELATERNLIEAEDAWALPATKSKKEEKKRSKTSSATGTPGQEKTLEPVVESVSGPIPALMPIEAASENIEANREFIADGASEEFEDKAIERIPEPVVPDTLAEGVRKDTAAPLASRVEDDHVDSEWAIPAKKTKKGKGGKSIQAFDVGDTVDEVRTPKSTNESTQEARTQVISSIDDKDIMFPSIDTVPAIQITPDTPRDFVATGAEPAEEESSGFVEKSGRKGRGKKDKKKRQLISWEAEPEFVESPSVAASSSRDLGPVTSETKLRLTEGLGIAGVVTAAAAAMKKNNHSDEPDPYFPEIEPSRAVRTEDASIPPTPQEQQIALSDAIGSDRPKVEAEDTIVPEQIATQQQHPLTSEATAEVDRRVSEPAQPIFSQPRLPSNLPPASFETQGAEHGTRALSLDDLELQPRASSVQEMEQLPGPKLGIEPDLSAQMDKNRDSGIQFSDPVVESVGQNRDSGYVPSPVTRTEWEDDSRRVDTDRPPRPLTPTSSSEDLKEQIRRVSTRSSDRDIARGVLSNSPQREPDPSRAVPNSPGLEAHREPSAVDSTTKDLSSGLFDSSPSYRNETATRDTQPEVSHPTAFEDVPYFPSPKDTNQMRAVVEDQPHNLDGHLAERALDAATVPSEPCSSIFGAPTSTELHERSVSPAKTPLQTIQEDDREDEKSPSLRRGRHPSAAVSPAESIPSVSRALTPGHDRRSTPEIQPPQKKLRHSHGTDDIRRASLGSEHSEGRESLLSPPPDVEDVAPRGTSSSDLATAATVAGAAGLAGFGAAALLPSRDDASDHTKYLGSGGNIKEPTTSKQRRGRQRNVEDLPSSSIYDPVNDKGKGVVREMEDVYVSAMLPTPVCAQFEMLTARTGWIWRSSWITNVPNPTTQRSQTSKHATDKRP
jgi:hypothetical protein